MKLNSYRRITKILKITDDIWSEYSTELNKESRSIKYPHIELDDCLGIRFRDILRSVYYDSRKGLTIDNLYFYHVKPHVASSDYDKIYIYMLVDNKQIELGHIFSFMGMTQNRVMDGPWMEDIDRAVDEVYRHLIDHYVQGNQSNHMINEYARIYDQYKMKEIQNSIQKMDMRSLEQLSQQLNERLWKGDK